MKQNKTLLYAFERVAETLNTTGLNENLFNTEEIKYLTERMELTDVQVYILVAFFNNIYEGMTLEQIRQALCWTSVQLLKNEVQIQDLVKRKYLNRERNNQQEIEYSVTQAAREAIRDNKPMDNVVKWQEDHFKKMSLVVRFEEVGNYLLALERDDNLDTLLLFENMPERFCLQVESIKAELNWTEEEIAVFAKLLRIKDARSEKKLFQSYNDRERCRQAVEALLNRRLIYSYDENGYEYCIMPTVLRQLEKGEQMCFPLEFADNDELFEGLHRQFKLRGYSFNNVKRRIYREMVYDLGKIIENNRHLKFCKMIDEMPLDEKDIVTLMYMCHMLVTYLKDEVSCSQLEKYVLDAEDSLHYLQDLRDGETNLQKFELVEHTGSNYTNGENIGLTRDARIMLLGDFKVVKSSLLNAKELRQPEKFAEKRMFYNERERGEVVRLTELLMPQTFKDVKRRLRECGERTGFVCLFYGAPGTGKTETVLQIARQTGRALYQVDISDINSKWIGESEKNIKGIFDRYREFAEHNTVEPILFFNEADGVFSRRFDTAASPNPDVTQMQNAIQSIVLQEMETLDGILIATTNLTQNLDPAMERRILYKVKFDKPATAVKAQLWQSSIPTLTADEARTLAQRYDFSGGQIENVKRKSVVDNILYGLNADYNRIDDYCSREMLAASRPRIGFGA
jgi:SpoVK/Ycf46/Vps4 family AAA+-type ATPase